jgi:hypothetical protein
MAFASKSLKKTFKTSKKGSGCYTCREEGHRFYECKKNPHKDIICRNCQGKGHMARDCKRKKKEKKEEGGKGYKKTLAFMSTQDTDLSNFWILDSRANHHLSGRRDLFSEFRQVDNADPVEGVSSQPVQVEGIGKIPLLCETETGEIVQIVLEEDRYTPSANVNLASLSKFLNKGAVLHGEGKRMTLQMEGENFLQGENKGTEMIIKTVKPHTYAFTANQGEQCRLWHRSFCHAGWETLAQMAKDSLVEGLPVTPEGLRKASEGLCEDCVMEKQTRKPFYPSIRESEAPLDLIHIDVCGPMQTETAGGSRYFVSFIDDYSRCAAIQLLRSKDQVKKALAAFVARIETQFEGRVKKLQSDRGKYWNKDTQAFCEQKGIIHEKTNPYSGQENGVAERLNRTLMKKARAMLLESGLDHRFWGEAVPTANFVRNRTCTTVHGKTPLEMLTGKKPQVDDLRVFGSTAYVHKPLSKRKKLDAVAENGILLGYEPRTKGYRILRQSDMKTVLISKDVTFDESEKKQPSEELWESSTRESVSPKGDGLKELGGARDLSHVSPLVSPGVGAPLTVEASVRDALEPGTTSNSDIGTEESSISEGERDEDEDVPEERTGEKGSAAPPKRVREPSRRERKPSQKYPNKDLLTANFLSEQPPEKVEPKTCEEALSRPDAELWQGALEEEFASLLENKTWEIRDVPPGAKPIPCKWTFKLKKDEHGNITRYKARLVAKGFKQKKGVDFEEVFAPVSRHVTLRTLLAMAASRDLEI